MDAKASLQTEMAPRQGQGQGFMANDEDRMARIGIWLTRAVILFVSCLFTFIGLRNFLFPIQGAGSVDITLHSAKALSVARVSMGAFPLGFAIFTATSLFMNNQLYRGILGVFILLFVVTVVRVIGFAIDGAAPFIAPETVFTILAGIALYMENRRKTKFVRHA